MNVPGSNGVRSKSSVVSERVTAAAPRQSQHDTDAGDGDTLCEHKRQDTAARRAEREAMPISRVDWLTAYASTP